MRDTHINELVEDEKQKLVYVFDIMTERCFFIELSEIITGKHIKGAKCTKKQGDAPKQLMDFNEFEAKTNAAALDLDERGQDQRRRPRPGRELLRRPRL